MDNQPAATGRSVPISSGQLTDSEHEYPDKLDFALIQIAAVCGLASLMAFLDSTVVAVAQRTFITEFGSTQAVVAWTIAGYLLAMAAVTPMAGWAADRFGTKRLFIGAVLVFTGGSVLCALAPNILPLIAFRVVQGFGGGLLVPLSFMIVTKESGPKRIGRLFALGAIPFVIGPIGGPILGGWLISAYGWKWIFLINVPIGLVACVAAAILFPKDRPEPSETLDIVGALLLSPGVAALLAGISAAPGRQTVADRYVLIPAIVGVSLIAAFVFHALHRADNPLIDLRLFANRVVAQANITQFVFAATFFGVGLIAPSYFQVALHQTPKQAGMHMVAMGVGVVLAIPLAGVLTDRRGPGKIVLIGLPMMAAGLAIFTYGVAAHPGETTLLLTGLLMFGLGVGFTSTPLTAACVQSLAPRQVARGTTLLTVNDQLGGCVGAALMAVLLTHQLDRDPNGPAEHISNAYITVFAVAVALAVFITIPGVLLYKRLRAET